MTLLMDADKRAALAEAKARVRELEDPIREAQRIARAKARKNRAKAIGKPAMGQRQPRVKDPAYLNWIRSLPCTACGKVPRSEAAHIRCGYPEAGWRPTGMQEKPDDRRTAPLCRTCHREGPKAQHAGNERAWWNALGIYPPELCHRLSERFDALQSGSVGGGKPNGEAVSPSNPRVSTVATPINEDPTVAETETVTGDVHPTTEAIIRALTPAQRKLVLAGYCNGSQTMPTIRAVRAAGLFYVDIDSPNGKCGVLRLTTFGRRVQSILQGRAALKEASRG